MKNFKTVLNVLLLVFFFGLFFACKSNPPLKTESSIKETSSTTDSISHKEKITMQLITIPSSLAALNLNLADLSTLPIGAKYEDKQGQATVGIEKTGENDYKITANCDSLSMIISEKETEIYHLQKTVKELEEKESQTIEVTKYKQNDWQIVCGWFGKIFMGVLGVGLIILVLKWKRFF